MNKASAVAGAVAWTAPLIVDSLSSPAAAGSQTHKISCSWFSVVFLKPGDSTMYFATADDSSAACANAHPPISQGPNVKTCNGFTCSSGVTGSATSSAARPMRTATYVSSPTGGSYIDIQGDTIQANR